MTYSTDPTFPSGPRPNRIPSHDPRERPVVNLKDSHLRNLNRDGRSEPVREQVLRSYDISILLDDGSVQYITHKAPSELYLEDICACFARGTLISTESGQTAIEDLQPGDKVKTRDNGFQSLRWVSACSLVARGEDLPEDSWPLRIKADALGELRPIQDLLVSPRFRLLTNHPSCAALFGSAETLAPSIDLLDGDTVLRTRPSADLIFYNLMFDAHQIIEANGLETESYHPGNFGVAVMSLEMQSHLRRIFPHMNGDLGKFGRTARPILKGFEAEVLRVG